MIIGIDGSRAFEEEKTGTERYSYEMLRALAKVDRENEYYIYVNSKFPDAIRNGAGKIQNSKLIINRDAKASKSGKNSPLPLFNKERVNAPSYFKRGLGELNGWPPNFRFVEIPWPKLWTQGGLALRTWIDKLDVLWVPAHTLPVLGNFKLPMVVTIHGIEYEYLPGAYKWGQNWHLTWSTRWAVKRASKVVAVSGRTKEDLVRKLGVDGNKIEVIHEGVDVDKFLISNNEFLNNIKYQKSKIKNTNQILNRYDIKSPYILFVGTVQPRKNLVRLIEAFAHICHPELDSGSRRATSSPQMLKPDFVKTTTGRQVQHDITLIIVGKMGWDYQEILEAPKRLRIEEKVKFLGFVLDEELSALYQGARLYVEPSLQEGFGLPVLEAMAAGVPVVAANAGALPEVVGEAGVLVDPMSVESIAEGMKRILGDEKLRKQLVERGYKRVREFSWEEAARRLVKVFEEVLGKGKAERR